MTFFKITANLLSNEFPTDDAPKRKFSENIKSCSKQFFDECNESLYFFISNIDSDSLTAGMIVNSSEYNVDSIVFPWKKMNLKVNNTKIEEICSSDFFELLDDGNHNEFSENTVHIIMQFNMRKICSFEGDFFFDSTAYSEKLVDDSLSADEMRASAVTLMWDKAFIPELERIEAHAQIDGIVGHPIHYMFCSDEYENQEKMVFILLSSLYQNKRLQIKRACSLDISGLDNREIACLNKLYESYSGGAVIIRYNKSDTAKSGPVDVSMEEIENICDAIKSNRNRVLTVLCFPNSCSKEKEQFFTYLENMTFLSMKESDIDKTRATEYLKNKAEANKCPTCNSLLDRITETRPYRVSELNRIFTEWLESYIKTDVYPQYKDLVSVTTECVTQIPLGNAYDKLHRMIGLSEVKSVIDSALDFFKAQKIFKAKGAFIHSPSMHMVFTGNPGTAKTTVARLFAEILRDNDVLSSGHLVEVGRSDLVGRYVGWTAKAVKDKFKEAQGGILFIDEAYSLLDDRDDSYGDEAINTIVQEMENNRGDIVVIFAGYPDKMSLFLDKNPGLRSRIAFRVPFSDYTPDELCHIAELMSIDKNLILEDSAKDKILCIFDEAVKQNDFGNGRYVRNLIEKATMHQATRLVHGKSAGEICNADIHTLTSEDFVCESMPKSEKHKIGFCA